MKTITIDFQDFLGQDKSDSFKTRESVRAVIFNKENKIAVIHAMREDYYVLPGGGVDEEDKNFEEAVKRESLEEAGLKVEVGEEFLKIIEFHRFEAKKMISHCYICKTDGEIYEQNLTEDEKKHDYILEWFELDEIIQKIKTNGYPHFIAKYTQLRNLTILEELKKLGY